MLAASMHRGAVLADYAYRGPAVTGRRLYSANDPDVHVDWNVGRDGLLRLTGSDNRHHRTGDPDTGRVLAKFDFLRDDSGSPTDKTVTQWYKTPELRQHGYDTLDRLEHIDYGPGEVEDFVMDLLGNRTSYTARDGSMTGYTSDEANQYTEVAPGGVPASPVYGAAGNRTADHRGYQLGRL